MVVSALPVLLAMGAAALLAGGGGKKAARPAVKKPLTDAERAARIVRESKEILQGGRESYTEDPDDAEPEPLQAEASSQSTAAERAAVTRKKKPTKPGKMQLGEVTVRAPADGLEAEALGSAIAAERGAAGAAGASPANPLPIAITTGDSGKPGFDVVAAKATAQRTADHIRTKASKYDRAVVALFQRRAGIADDGLYGPLSASALRAFGAKNVPPPLFKGALKTYQVPGG